MPDIGDHFGVNTYSYTQSMSAAECLRRLADQGVRSFELMFYPGHLWITDAPQTLADIRGVAAANGLEIISLNSPNIDLNIAAATEEMRALSLKQNQAFIRIAGELGAQGLILGPGKPNPLFPLPRDILETYFFSALDVLIPIAERSSVSLFVENMPFAFLPEAESVMDSLARYGNEDIKVCYDIANAHFIKENPTVGLQKVASRLALVHVSDTTQSVYRHDAVGAGNVDFASLPAALAASGYREPVMLEIISAHADQDLANSAAVLRQMGF